MASQALSRRFSVAASPERVWTYLTTPELVVTCLPGAALLSSSEDGRHHEGTVTVKLGAISVGYKGTAEFVEVDAEQRRLRVSAKGRENTGSGSAEMTMQADVLAAEDGCHVELDASVNVTGKIVTLGRGMIGIVSAQVMSEFVTCLSGRLADGRRAPPPEEAEPAPGPGATATGTSSGEPAGDARCARSADEPIEGFSLLWRAIGSWVRRLFGRR
jgi:carbon monoxide dehydrogenase subunit G